MKKGTTPTLRIQLDNLDFTKVAEIKFIFKQQKDEWCDDKIIKTYPGDVLLDEDKKLFSIHFKEEETRSFEGGESIYMDTKITFLDGNITGTNIVSILVSDTLFGDND